MSAVRSKVNCFQRAGTRVNVHTLRGEFVGTLAMVEVFVGYKATAYSAQIEFESDFKLSYGYTAFEEERGFAVGYIIAVACAPARECFYFH